MSDIETPVKVFRSGNSQAIRLPVHLAYADNVELVAVRQGDTLTIRPVRPSLQDLVGQLRDMTRPSDIEVRDTGDIDERDGL